MAIKKDGSSSILILACVTFNLFLETAIIKGFSVLLPTLKEQFSTQTWIIGSSISLISGWGYILGLTASPLKHCFGSRMCIVSSGIITSAGLIVCTIAESIFVLLFGCFLLGFFFLQENVAVGTVPEYFDKYYDVAVNVFCFGTPVAIIMTPPLTQVLLDIYGWRGTMILFCGLSLHTIPCGLLFQSKLNSERAEDRKPLYLEISDAKKQHQTSLLGRLRPFVRAFDIVMFTSFPFVFRVVLPAIVNGYILSSWLIYIIPFAVEKGATLKEASLVSTCGGIGIAVVRIFLPFLNTLITYRQLMYISSVLISISLFLTTMQHSVVGLCLSSVIFGIGYGTLVIEIYIATKDVVRPDQYVNAVSWFHLITGVFMIVGATITGAVYDATESFQISFWILAAISLGICVSLGLEDVWILMQTPATSAPL